jgi:hypothetical protein
MPYRCALTVHESTVLTTLGLALSKKQIPQFQTMLLNKSFLDASED